MSRTFEWRIYLGLVGVCVLAFAVVAAIAVLNVPNVSGYLDLRGPASAQSTEAQTLSQVDTDLALSQALLQQAAADTEGSNK